MRRIAFTALRRAELVDAPDLTGPVPPNFVRGRTLVSLVSSGTELNYGYLNLRDSTHPIFPGYAAIFRIESVGEEVKDLAPGAIVYSGGGHGEFQQMAREDVLPLPDGLAPEAAVFARLAGIGMTTLATTTARPPARVLITGLGPVGNLAAQVFSACGYRVTTVDPAAPRRATARQAGLEDVRAAVTGGPDDLTDQIALHVECSGHEQAALHGCRVVRKRGEVVLLGTPWSRKTDIPAFDLLYAVFHRYVVLRSGWEWEIPAQPRDFAVGSLTENYRAALEWIAAGRLRVGGLASLYQPAQAQDVYAGLLAQSLPTPSAVFDWRT